MTKPYEKPNYPVSDVLPEKWWEDDSYRHYEHWVRPCGIMGKPPSEVFCLTTEDDTLTVTNNPDHIESDVTPGEYFWGPYYATERYLKSASTTIFQWDDIDDFTYIVYKHRPTGQIWVESYNTDGEGGQVYAIFVTADMVREE